MKENRTRGPTSVTPIDSSLTLVVYSVTSWYSFSWWEVSLYERNIISRRNEVGNTETPG